MPFNLTFHRRPPYPSSLPSSPGTPEVSSFDNADKFRLPSVLIGPPPGPESSTCFGASNFNRVRLPLKIIAATDPKRRDHPSHGAAIPRISRLQPSPIAPGDTLAYSDRMHGRPCSNLIFKSLLIVPMRTCQFLSQWYALSHLESRAFQHVHYHAVSSRLDRFHFSLSWHCSLFHMFSASHFTPRTPLAQPCGLSPDRPICPADPSTDHTVHGCNAFPPTVPPPPALRPASRNCRRKTTQRRPFRPTLSRTNECSSRYEYKGAVGNLR